MLRPSRCGQGIFCCDCFYCHVFTAPLDHLRGSRRRQGISSAATASTACRPPVIVRDRSRSRFKRGADKARWTPSRRRNAPRSGAASSIVLVCMCVHPCVVRASCFGGGLYREGDGHQAGSFAARRLDRESFAHGTKGRRAHARRAAHSTAISSTQRRGGRWWMEAWDCACACPRDADGTRVVAAAVRRAAVTG